MDNFSRFLNYLAAIIIAVAVFGALFLTYNLLNTEYVKPQTLNIDYKISKIDSLNSTNEIEIRKIDSLFRKIQSTTNLTQEAQNQLIEEKQKDDFFNKLYTAIIAVILAIAGFFGFKSVSEIKQRAITDAKEQARYIADKEFEQIFDKKYRASVMEEATEAMSGIIKEELGQLEERIAKLEQNIDTSAINGNDDNGTQNEQPENPFGDE